MLELGRLHFCLTRLLLALNLVEKMVKLDVDFDKLLGLLATLVHAHHLV